MTGTQGADACADYTAIYWTTSQVSRCSIYCPALIYRYHCTTDIFQFSNTYLEYGLGNPNAITIINSAVWESSNTACTLWKPNTKRVYLRRYKREKSFGLIDFFWPIKNRLTIGGKGCQRSARQGWVVDWAPIDLQKHSPTNGGAISTPLSIKHLSPDSNQKGGCVKSGRSGTLKPDKIGLSGKANKCSDAGVLPTHKTSLIKMTSWPIPLL